jgi:hypothetical protein
MDASQTVRVNSAPRSSLRSIAKQFLLPAAFLTGIPQPLYLAIQFKSGQWVDVLLPFLVWRVVLFLYRLPLGALLFGWRDTRWRGSWWGYAVITIISEPRPPKACAASCRGRGTNKGRRTGFGGAEAPPFRQTTKSIPPW